MNYIKYIYALVILIMSLPIFAANVGTGITKIVRIENWVSEEGLFIKTGEAVSTNPANCSITDKYQLGANTSNVSRSMLLTAYTAKLPVNLVIYGGGCSATNGPSVVAVVLSE